MKKYIYLYIYFIAISNFFSIIPFGYLNDIGRGFPILIFLLLWLFIGFNKYKTNIVPKLKTSSNNQITFWLFLSILPSIFMADFLFGQSFGQSIISYRNFWLYLAIPTFLSIRPTIEDINKSIYYYAITFLIICLIRTFLPFQFYTVSEQESKMISSLHDSSNSNFINMPSFACYEIILIPFYYYCVSLWKKFDKKIAFRTLLLFGIFVIIQNRSTLFPALIVFGITIIKCNIKPRFLKPFIILSICILSISIISKIILILFEETQTQLSSTYDPRIIALDYFLDFKRLSIWEILFGTGNISFQTSNYVANLQAHHIHYSDVGFIGFWSQFGLFPIVIFSYYLLKCIFIKAMPLFEKLVATHILICSVTISYFEAPAHMIWFILFYYLYCYFNTSQKFKKII